MILRRAKHLNRKSVIVLDDPDSLNRKLNYGVLSIKSDGPFVQLRVKCLTEIEDDLELNLFDDDYVEILI